jgi:sigma-54 dependent transcriptional regulator, acetoin dehydrogenase operon transcriptional activator AcoR
LEIPPLREHPEDILYILTRYLEERYGLSKRFSATSSGCLLRYGWPGNIRELINLAEYLCISSRDADAVELEHLPRSLVETCGRKEETFQSAPNPSQKMILQHLEKSPAAAATMSCLLRILHERRRMVTGRASLLREMGSRDHFVTEAKLKRTLQSLREAGLVHIGTTKQGTVLTQQGQDFLDYLTTASKEDPPASN